MLELIARLLVALGVTAGGLAGAQTHASPGGSSQSMAAVEAVISALGSSVQHAAAAGTLDLTGLDLALTKANEHAAKGLATAVAAKAAGQAKGAAASAGSGAADHAPTLPSAATDNPGADHRP
ncbi:MAG TPA: hypothetical protein VFI34_11995 [Candidatus Limnocylindrales bacterium]|nr:hypothetical protein [Candidatus Limnocylindrales bacterium]